MHTENLCGFTRVVRALLLIGLVFWKLEWHGMLVTLESCHEKSGLVSCVVFISLIMSTDSQPKISTFYESIIACAPMSLHTRRISMNWSMTMIVFRT